MKPFAPDDRKTPTNGSEMRQTTTPARKLIFPSRPPFMDDRRGPRPGVNLGAALALVLLLGGCAVADNSHSNFQPDRAERVFATGYANIQDKYIDPVNIADIAFEGIENLDDIDPNLQITKSQNIVHLANGDAPGADIAMPEGRDPHSWARFTTRTIVAARNDSPALKAADSETIYKTVFSGALLPLDRHSRYVGFRSARNYRAQREGFGGIGVRLDFDGDLPEIVAVLPDTPAKRSPLRSGDIITHVDDRSLIGLGRHNIIWRLRGLQGTTVRLRAIRESSDTPIVVTLRRSLIFNRTVEYERRGSMAVIRVTGFNQRTSRDLEHVVVGLPWNEDPPINGIVLDLRNNPGGLLDQAVAVADAFLRKGRIVSTRGRHPESIQRFDATGRDLANGMPMVVLVNGRSASAAEIVAAALQDRGRAVVVGSNSYGKGTVQNITRLPNDGELILTWSRFHAPSGYALDALGVLPNICTATVAASDNPDLHNRVLAAIRQSANLLAKWRKLTDVDESRRSRLRENCPKRTEKPEIDLKIAQEILADRRLYARALGMSAPLMAKKKRSTAYTN
ncbi:MAG: PDZ domain-containing protein [Alphaproteobacteria bacterium]|nr:MAG: PDZ domain-containing protein [Alphaproteobacteria bacterium]